jgi:phosphatidylglycerol:prolipoprotein diacylglycerol transferase
VHPVLFTVGGVDLHAYGVLFAGGIAVGLLIAVKGLVRDGLPADLGWDAALAMLVGAIAGARLEYVRSHLSDFQSDPLRVLALRDGGMVFYGGFIGAVACMTALLMWRRAPTLRVLDAFAAPLPIGHALGRIGCVMAGCCWGAPTDARWALRYPSTHASGGSPVHPVQLYEAAFDLSLGLVLVWLHHNGRRRFDGQVLALLLLCYPVARLLLETLRGDATRGWAFWGLTNAQATSLALLAAGAALWIRGSAASDRRGPPSSA